MSRLETVVQNMIDGTPNVPTASSSRLEILLIQLCNKYNMEIEDIEALINEINGEGA